jgi:hypothetical protein
MSGHALKYIEINVSFHKRRLHTHTRYIYIYIYPCYLEWSLVDQFIYHASHVTNEVV